nr:MAG TPA: hypothetical protein [Caudoviricetes sp.]
MLTHTSCGESSPFQNQVRLSSSGSSNARRGPE